MCPRSVEVWVSSESLPSLSHRQTHTDGDVWTLRTRRYFIPLWKLFFPIDFYSFESLYANSDKSEPHVGSWSPAKPSGAGCTANVGMRTPFFFLPPFLLQSVWTTPKQEVHFLFFLKKDLVASVFSSKLTCTTHYQTGVDMHAFNKSSPCLQIRTQLQQYNYVI